MVLVVKCLICNKELTYTQGDSSILVAHFKFEHSSLKDKKGKGSGGGEPNIEDRRKKLDEEKEVKLANQSIQTDLKFLDMNRGKIMLFYCFKIFCLI